MPLLDQIRNEKLIELAKARFDPKLKRAELKVLRDSASSEELPEPDEKALRPVVRAAFLRWLATDPDAAPHIDCKGIRVYAATLLGNFDLEGSRVPVRLDFRRCTAKGEINLEQAETQDILFLNSSLEGETGFCADTIHVHGLLLLKGSSFSGTISLGGARIEGDLDCSGAKLEVKKGRALFADGAEIGGDVFFRKDSGSAAENPIFEASGEIRMVGATIKGDLSLLGAKLTRTEKSALTADGADIGGNVSFSKSLVSSGTIRLRGAGIGAYLDFSDADVAEVDCANLRLTGDLLWKGIQKPAKPFLKLTGASVKNLRDDIESWPEQDKLLLNDLVYEELTLEPQPRDAREGTRARIEWLKRQPDKRYIRPQPWMQLSKYLEARGRHREAKHVLYELHRLQARKLKWHPLEWVGSRLFHRRSLQVLPGESSEEDRSVFTYLRRAWAIFFAWLEEAPARILWLIGTTLFLGTLIFSGTDRSGAMIPSTKDRYDPQASSAMEHYPPFQPFVYTLENALPMAKLGIDDKWMPDPTRGSYLFLATSRWLLILLGWFYAGVLGAALSGRFKE